MTPEFFLQLAQFASRLLKLARQGLAGSTANLFLEREQLASQMEQLAAKLRGLQNA